MIETKQLEYLVVCARLGSFSRAAEALYTTQPNVSKVIRTLEQELGFSLFIRQSRGIVLTSRGRRIYEYASKAVEQVEQLVSFARMDKGEELLASLESKFLDGSVLCRILSGTQSGRCVLSCDDSGYRRNIGSVSVWQR